MRAISAGIAGLTLLSATVAALPAHAGTTFHKDARHDVMRVVADPNGPGESFIPVPQRKVGDIVSIRTTYRDRLTVDLKLAALQRPTRQVVGEILQIDTARRQYMVQLTIDSKYPRGAVVMLNDAENGFQRCHVRHRVDYRHSSIRVSVPASCLKNARAVRVGAGMIVQPGMHGDSAFVDDAYSSKVDANDLALSPRVRRG